MFVTNGSFVWSEFEAFGIRPDAHELEDPAFDYSESNGRNEMSDMTYYHDLEQRRVWARPNNPDVTTRFDRNGNVIGWYLNRVVETVRSDNWLNSKGWHYATDERQTQHIDNLSVKSENEAIEHFNGRHPAPKDAKIISFFEYEELAKQYEEEARLNGPPEQLEGA